MIVPFRNKIELVNELIIQSSTFHLFCFTQWVDEKGHDIIGLSLVIHVIFLIFVNLIFIS